MAEDVQIPPLPKTNWYQALLTPWTVTIGAPLMVLLLDTSNTVEVISFALKAFVGTAPYIAFAVVLIAWLKAADAESVVTKVFEGRENRMILFAALFGGLAPFCSCEVIPFIAGLLVLGAPLSAIMAFWLSSPLIDPPTLFITAGALGWPFAVGKAVSAVYLGLLGGYSIKFLVAGGLFSQPSRKAAPGGCCNSSGCSSTTKNHRAGDSGPRLREYGFSAQSY